MKVGLINAPTPRQTKHSKINPPLGLAYIGSYLIKNNHDVDAVDMNISGYSKKRIERMVNKGVEAFGISAQTETFPAALKIASEIKKIDDEIPVVLGGPHPTLKPKETISNPNIDFAILGEGEKTFIELIENIENPEKPINKIKGLVYEENNEIHINQRREPLNLDDLIIPNRRLFSLDFYEQPWTVLTSRGGCRFNCPFCSVSSIWSTSKRYRKTSDIRNEIEYLLYRENAQYIFFVDDTLTADREWTEKLLKEIKEIEKPFRWGCSTRIDLVDRELIKKMNKHGCNSIQFGMETGSQQILNEIKNGLNKEKALDLINYASEQGIDIACTFMFPHPQDTQETLNETKEYMSKLSENGAKVLLSCTTPFPGTKYREKAEKYGINILTDDWSKYDAKHLVMETKNLPKNKLQEKLTQISRELELKSSL